MITRTIIILVSQSLNTPHEETAFLIANQHNTIVSQKLKLLVHIYIYMYFEKVVMAEQNQTGTKIQKRCRETVHMHDRASTNSKPGNILFELL